MVTYMVNSDICTTDAEIIVNASNGIGYMGGSLSARIKTPGVAESIQYQTKGKAQEEAKKEANLLHMKKPGSVFVTSACGLKARYITHAVTMRFPGSKSSYSTIERLLPLIEETCLKLNCKSVAIPLLGAGTGSLNKITIEEMIVRFFEDSELDVSVYVY